MLNDTDTTEAQNPAQEPIASLQGASEPVPAAGESTDDTVESTTGVPKKPRTKSAPKTKKSSAPKAGTKKDKSTKSRKSSADIETLTELGDAFLAHLVSRGRSPGTARSYGADLAVAKSHFGADTKIASLTTRKVGAYFASDAVNKTRDGKPKNPVTSAKIRRVLRMALEFAAEKGIIAEAPIPTEK